MDNEALKSFIPSASPRDAGAGGTRGAAPPCPSLGGAERATVPFSRKQ